LTDSKQLSETDYLVIGHISSDITEYGYKLGGTAAYSATVAGVLGYRAAIITSAAEDYVWDNVLPGIQVHHIPSPSTTTFENIYTPAGRHQKIHSIASRLTSQHVPEPWLDTPIVHLGPIADEIDPDVIYRFENSILGITPQGWLRDWDDKGYVRAKNSVDAKRIFPKATAVILSEEDLMDRKQLDRYRSWSSLLVLTQGSRGCTVTFGKETRHIPVKPVSDVDPTGAGDVFAAAFLIHYHQTGGDPWKAAQYANTIAASTVSEPDLESKATRIRDTQSKLDKSRGRGVFLLNNRNC